MNKMKLAALILILAVILGAFGAHALAERLTDKQLKAWHTGVEYQFYHGLGLLLLAVVPGSFIRNEKSWKLAANCMIAGIILFSGSIYLLTTQDLSGIHFSWLGPVTPIGGLCFILGWVMVFLSVEKKK